MTLTHLIAFNLTLLAAMAAPGPAFLFAIKQAVSGGFWTGVATGAGLGLVAAAWTGAALLGLDVIFRLFPFIYTALKIGGALYLMYLAWSIWKSAKEPLSEAAQPGAKAFWGGVLVNLANPKSVLFAASVLIVIFPEGLSLAEKGLIVLNHFCVELVVYALMAAALASPPARAGYLRLKPIFDRIAALVLGALGLRLLLNR
ncbi:LysE family translocator [Roseovarius rhodophyticola]|uniref:LysE family translocator n=1 Tax=Roseovarius rhodophyticola TaxID=3080827 RepID=A0ABZ2TEM1_9RHOB|nr:LysE family translocator [Roseovarius sp. W115]MDV2928406.1 LysE family translocator [Roseovarius sp. W115]